MLCADETERNYPQNSRTASQHICSCHRFVSRAQRPLMCRLCCRLCLQLAFCTGEHQVAAAPVPAAEGGAAGGPRRGPGPPARPGALLGRLGPHASDRRSV